VSESVPATHASEPEVLVRSLKFDGRLHREWRARLSRRDGPLLVLEGAFAEEVCHPLLGTIPQGALSTEYYWLDRWYSVFRFREPSGEHRYFYCNVSRSSTDDS
jgi:protein associated with RNAse G/E